MPGKILSATEQGSSTLPIVWTDTSGDGSDVQFSAPYFDGVGIWSHIHPTNPNRMLLLSDRVHWSSDGGLNWTQATGSYYSKVQRAVRFGSNTTAWTCGLSYLGVPGATIYKSSDLGETFQQVGPVNDQLCNVPNPVVTYNRIDDCGGQSFSVEVTINGFSGGLMNIRHIINHQVTNFASGVSSGSTTLVGPFTLDSIVQIEVVSQTNPDCISRSGQIKTDCVIPIICGDPMLVQEYCTRSGESVVFQYENTSGIESTRIRFYDGLMDGSTVVSLYEGLGTGGTILASGTFADLCGVEVSSIGQSITLGIDTGSTAPNDTCEINSVYSKRPFRWNVSCTSGFLYPNGSVSVINADSNSYQYEVNVLDPGDGFDILYSVNYGPWITEFSGESSGGTFLIPEEFACSDKVIVKLRNVLDPSVEVTLCIPDIPNTCIVEDEDEPSVFMDVFPLNDNVVYAITNSEPFGDRSCLIKTADGGANWTLECVFNDFLPSFDGIETVRRIWMTGQNSGYLLTRAKVYKLIKISGSWTGTLLYDYRSDVNSTFPLIPLSNLDTNVDDSYTFDQIFYSNGFIWIFGNYGLMAKSTVGDTNFQLINTGMVVNDPNILAYSSGYFIDENNGWIYYSNLLNQRSGIWSTNSGGSGLNPLSPAIGFPVDGVLGQTIFKHIWYSPFASLLPGCTSTEACNYDPAAQSDDGSCVFTSLLTNCQDGTQISVNSEDIFWESCWSKYVDIDINNISGSTGHQIILTVSSSSGTSAINFNFFSYAGYNPSNVNDFIEALIAYINSNPIGITAIRIRQSNNTLNPGSLNGIRILCSSTDCQTITFSTTNLSGFLYSSTTFQNPEQGSVISLSEFPDQCWTVCGRGDCNDVTDPVTISEIFQDCFSCIPYRANNLCLNCDSMVSVSGNPITDHCKDSCIHVGDQIQINLAVGFPLYESQQFTPDELDQECVPGCNLVLTIPGDNVSSFPPGSIISVYNEDTDTEINYTVSTSEYLDPNTIVTTAEPCTNDTIGVVTSFVECFADANITIISNGNVVFDQDYFPTDSYIQEGVSFDVADLGPHEVIITARDCANTRICNYNFITCSRYTIEKDCKEITITNETPEDSPRFLVKITDSSNNIISNNLIVSTLSTTIDLENDDVYKVEITPLNSLDQPVGDKNIYSVFILCDTIKCIKKLMTDIWCNDDDGCCEDCSKEQERKRDQLNRIFAILGLLSAKYHSDKVKWFLDGEDVDVFEASELLKRLKMLIDRCGQCKKDNKTTKKPCLNC